MKIFGLEVNASSEVAKLREAVTHYSRALEDVGWTSMSNAGEMQSPMYGGKSFCEIIRRCRTLYNCSALVGRWCNVTSEFVFGEGVSMPTCSDEKVQEIVSKFWDDKDNQASLTGYLAQIKLSDKLQYEGNLFFALFTDDAGDVRVRVLDTLEIADVICDPDDRSRPLFYKVRVVRKNFNFQSGTYTIDSVRFKYYPDISVPKGTFNDYGIPDSQLVTDAAIYHVKINCDINDKFGIPDVFRGDDWVKAHKDMASDLATLINALSQLAWKKKVKGNASQVAAIRNALQTKMTLSNIRPATAATQIENESIDTSPINTPTGGAVIGEKGLKQMALQVCAASGLPYHIFGDPDNSNLATTKSLELPLIKKFAKYQRLWIDIHGTILLYQIERKIDLGILPGSVEYNEKTNRDVYATELDLTIDEDFPPILEEDLLPLAQALSTAKQGNMVSDKTAATQFLMGANINNIEDELKEIETDKEKRKKEAAEIGGSVFPPGSFGNEPAKAKSAPESEDGKTVKEDAIGVAPRDKAARLAGKNNLVLQRMNGYKRVLQGHYRMFQNKVKESMHIDGTGSQFSGHIDNLSGHLKRLKDGMSIASHEYFGIASDIGSKYTQAHIREARLQEAGFNRRDFVQRKTEWNDLFLEKSFIPDIERKIMETVRMPYESKSDFETAVSEAMASLEARVGMYAGAFWIVEEQAVKEAGTGTGLMVKFVGADDDSTCEGCKEAMEGGPYPIESAPEPGSHQCHSNCRHALQIVS